ncbi:hypothetical protein ACQKOH_23755, partial [Sphingomonas sp. NPDC092331]|uniref:hypothetical protein n=1 Tax=unclassified Sphingomonas TaxID=196159 RepID=UPI003D04F9DA
RAQGSEFLEGNRSQAAGDGVSECRNAGDTVTPLPDGPALHSGPPVARGAADRVLRLERAGIIPMSTEEEPEEEHDLTNLA